MASRASLKASTGPYSLDVMIHQLVSMLFLGPCPVVIQPH